MDGIDRRRFVGTSVGLAAGIAASTGAVAAEGQDPPAAASPPPPQVALGQTGIRASRLALGTGFNGSKRQSAQTRLGFEKLVALCRHACDRGITFFDAADLYGSHIYLREALRGIPREKITLLTKIWWQYDGPVENTTAAYRARMAETTLERFRHELATDYLDIVLLHCLTDPRWVEKMKPYTETLDRHKERGLVKAVGVSCHDFGALKAAAAAPWVDVILARINAHQIHMDSTPEEVIAVLRQAKAAGKTVIGMKIFGAGQLLDRREECIRYAQGHDFMDAMTIGFTAPEQLDEVLTLMAKYPAAAG